MTDDKVKKVDEIYKRFENDFEGSLHSVLWQIMVNGSIADQRAAFHVEATKHNQLTISLASGGYIPATAWLKTKDHSEAVRIAEALSLEVFGLADLDAVREIVMLSMRTAKK